VLGRRGVLAGALGVVALSACDVDDLRPPEDDTTPTPSPTASGTPQPDADLALAQDLAHEMSVALVVVDQARRSFPGLRARLRPLARMHRAHLAVLEPPDRSVPLPEPVGSPADALAALRGVEDALQRRLADGSVEAGSGALARLLASVAASVAQHTATHLPAPAVDGSGA
jgi:hypothetical protein